MSQESFYDAPTPDICSRTQSCRVKIGSVANFIIVNIPQVIDALHVAVLEKAPTLRGYTLSISEYFEQLLGTFAALAPWQFK